MPHLLSRTRATSPALMWGVMCLVGAFAAVLRFWALDSPGSLVFDELYYVRDAITQLAHGYPTVWPNANPAAFGTHAESFTDTAAAISHPPLGKWLIGLGITVFGAESGWGWRSAAAAFGTLTVLLTMLIGWRLTRNAWVAGVAGYLLAVDGVHVTLSRVGLLDVFLTFFVVLGALCVWEDLRFTHHAHARDPRPAWWYRPWLWGAAASFGAATAVKWSGLFALLAFGLLLVSVDLVRRLQRHEPAVAWRTIRNMLGMLCVTLPIALLVYVSSWLGWITQPGGHSRNPEQPWWVSLWQWHTNGLGWHSTLTAEHPYQSLPIGWPLGLRPTAMYLEQWDRTAGCDWAAGCAAAITPVPNLLITWGAVVALVLLVWALIRPLIRPGVLPTPAAFTPVAAFIITGYLSGWLPWVLLVSRSAVFQFYMVVTTPFAALALALVLGGLVTAGTRTVTGMAFPSMGIPLDSTHAMRTSRRISVALYLGATLIVTALFYPVWSGQPIAEWWWRALRWLPGWS